QQRAQPGVARNVERDSLAFQCVEVAAQRRPGPSPAAARDDLRRALPLRWPSRAVLAQDLRGDTLADLARGGAVLEQGHVGMRMDVNETRRDDLPARVNDPPRGCVRSERPDGCDPVP